MEIMEENRWFFIFGFEKVVLIRDGKRKTGEGDSFQSP